MAKVWARKFHVSLARICCKGGGRCCETYDRCETSGSLLSSATLACLEASSIARCRFKDFLIATDVFPWAKVMSQWLFPCPRCGYTLDSFERCLLSGLFRPLLLDEAHVTLFLVFLFARRPQYSSSNEPIVRVRSGLAALRRPHRRATCP